MITFDKKYRHLVIINVLIIIEKTFSQLTYYNITLSHY